MARGSAVFLDTSIHIARMFHTPGKRRKIAERIRGYDISVTSSVVRNEFKRRVLKEAQYLLNLLNKYDSLDATMSHVLNVLTPEKARQQKISLNICLDMLPNVYKHGSDSEHAERARRWLRTLLRSGLSYFDSGVDHVIRKAGCACSKYPITEKKPYKSYEFGPSKCSATGHLCEIVAFLTQNSATTKAVLDHLLKVPEKKRSQEIAESVNFLQCVISKPEVAQSLEPCSKVGDLLIALESVDIPVFYTLNAKESQHFCRVLHQTLVFRPNNPEADDVVCAANAPSWPEF